MEKNNTIQYSEINELQIFLNDVTAYITYGEAASVKYRNCSEENFVVSFVNGVWKIKELDGFPKLENHLLHRATITIILPKSCNLKKVGITLKDGCVYGVRLSADRISFAVDSGTIKFDNISICEAEIKCEMGNIQLNGSVTGQVNTWCNMGNVLLALLSNDIFSYWGKVEMGSVHVLSEVFTNKEFSSHMEGKKGFEITCKMGNVTIRKRA